MYQIVARQNTKGALTYETTEASDIQKTESSGHLIRRFNELKPG